MWAGVDHRNFKVVSFISGICNFSYDEDGVEGAGQQILESSILEERGWRANTVLNPM